jgi:hypothetical protein
MKTFHDNYHGITTQILGENLQERGMSTLAFQHHLPKPLLPYRKASNLQVNVAPVISRGRFEHSLHGIFVAS